MEEVLHKDMENMLIGIKYKIYNKCYKLKEEI